MTLLCVRWPHPTGRRGKIGGRDKRGNRSLKYHHAMAAPGSHFPEDKRSGLQAACRGAVLRRQIITTETPPATNSSAQVEGSGATANWLLSALFSTAHTVPKPSLRSRPRPRLPRIDSGCNCILTCKLVEGSHIPLGTWRGIVSSVAVHGVHHSLAFGSSHAR